MFLVVVSWLCVFTVSERATWVTVNDGTSVAQTSVSLPLHHCFCLTCGVDCCLIVAAHFTLSPSTVEDTFMLEDMLVGIWWQVNQPHVASSNFYGWMVRCDNGSVCVCCQKIGKLSFNYECNIECMICSSSNFIQIFFKHLETKATRLCFTIQVEQSTTR